ncbi:MAG: hypothetical protein SGPRY_014365, partial [Prymnesium sp.]
LYGAWLKLQAHKAGECPYLEEIGTLQGTDFLPHGGVIHHRVQYGAICELVRLEVKRQGKTTRPVTTPLAHFHCGSLSAGSLTARVYKAVAETLVQHSANPRSIVPHDLHMTVREIYKTCCASLAFSTSSHPRSQHSSLLLTFSVSGVVIDSSENAADPGFGAGTGSGAYSPGLQAGGSSTKASTSGAMLGKGVATMKKKVASCHQFQLCVWRFLLQAHLRVLIATVGGRRGDAQAIGHISSVF